MVECMRSPIVLMSHSMEFRMVAFPLFCNDSFAYRLTLIEIVCVACMWFACKYCDCHCTRCSSIDCVLFVIADW